MPDVSERILTAGTVLQLLPEIVLIATATLIYVLGAFLSVRWLWSWIAGAGLVAAALALSQVGGAGMSGPLADDAFGLFVRWFALGIGALFVMLAGRIAMRPQGSEVVGSLLLAVVGVMVVSTSQELVMLFLGLELISIPTYTLLFLGRKNIGSYESTVKYFFLNILASAFMLYGFSFLYGLAGSTHLVDVQAALASGVVQQKGWSLMAALAVLFIFAGLGFKIAAVPFHFYAPDVYQGTTNANAAILSILPKVAGLAALIRVLLIAMPTMEPIGWRIALIVAILTMTIGNILALWQDSLRRLLAYSSIAHAGYMLIGLAVAFAIAYSGDTSATGFDGVAAILLYMTVYAVATLGTFAAMTYLGDERHEVDGIDELAGLGRSQPFAAITLAVFMFSLAGIPPLAGFWGKLALFGSALTVDADIQGSSPLRGWFVWLAIIGVINATIAAVYYLRIVGVMYFRKPLATPQADGGGGAWLAMALSAMFIVGTGAATGSLWESSLRASSSLRDTNQTSQENAVLDEVEQLRIAIGHPADFAIDRGVPDTDAVVRSGTSATAASR